MTHTQGDLSVSESPICIRSLPAQFNRTEYLPTHNAFEGKLLLLRASNTSFPKTLEHRNTERLLPCRCTAQLNLFCFLGAPMMHGSSHCAAPPTMSIMHSSPNLPPNCRIEYADVATFGHSQPEVVFAENGSLGEFLTLPNTIWIHIEVHLACGRKEQTDRLERY